MGVRTTRTPPPAPPASVPVSFWGASGLVFCVCGAVLVTVTGTLVVPTVAVADMPVVTRAETGPVRPAVSVRPPSEVVRLALSNYEIGRASCRERV